MSNKFEHREGQGSMFANPKAGEGSTQPNWRGKIKVGGKIYLLSAWNKTTAGGDNWLSLSAKEEEHG